MTLIEGPTMGDTSPMVQNRQECYFLLSVRKREKPTILKETWQVQHKFARRKLPMPLCTLTNSLRSQKNEK